MSVIRGTNSASTTTAAVASLSVPIEPNADGDIIVLAWHAFGSAVTMSSTGFSSAATANNGNAKVGFLYKVNSGGTTAANITVTPSASAFMRVQSYVIRGQHATPIGANASASGSATKLASAAQVTTTAANSLILHSFGVLGATPPQPTLGTFNALGAGPTGNSAAGSGADFVAGSGVASTAFSLGRDANDTFIDLALEIKSATGSIPICATPGRTVVEYNGGFGSMPTWSAPNNATIGITSIDGVSMDSQSSTLTYGRLSGETFNASRIAQTSTAFNAFIGGFETLSADLSGKMIAIPWARGRASTDRAGSHGMICVFVDTSNNWVAYTLRSVVDGWLASTRYVKFLKHGTTTALASGGPGGPGSYVPANNAYLGIFCEGTTGTAAGDNLIHIGAIWSESSPTVFTGGSSASPLTVEYLARHLSSAGQWHGICSIQGTKQFLGGINHQVGDGTIPTYFKSTGQSFAFRPISIDYAVGSGDAGLILKGSSTDTFDMSSSIVAGESLQDFSVDAASDLAATINLTGASFINLNWAAEASIDYSGASYDTCNLLELGGGTVAGATISAPQGESGATVSVSGGTLSGCALAAGTDYNLTLGTDVTAITLTNTPMTGTPAVNKVHVLATTGTVTITISGSTSLSAGEVTSEGATVVISAPLLYQSVTISNLTTGSRVQIYDTTSSTALSNSVAAGTSVTWTDSVAAAASRAIRVRISYVSGTSAKNFIEGSIGTCGVTEGTESVSYLANQTNDTTYNTNAEDGSAVTGITFTDAATDLVNVNIAAGSTTWQKIYAAFVYWISTEAGIADDIAYVDGVDPANYLLTAMKIKNTSSPSVPLTITGGFGRDATTGTIEDIIDTTGGNIYPLVDHVVSKVVTVSGVNVITGDIADIPAAPSAATVSAQILADAETTPITANIKQINSLAVDGAGTEADPWGPV